MESHMLLQEHPLTSVQQEHQRLAFTPAQAAFLYQGANRIAELGGPEIAGAASEAQTESDRLYRLLDAHQQNMVQQYADGQLALLECFNMQPPQSDTLPPELPALEALEHVPECLHLAAYVRHTSAQPTLITPDYSFIYHEHVYGYADHDLLGFGVGAISSVAQNVVTNTSLREQYITKMSAGDYVCQVSQHAPMLDLVKPVVLRLPYHGVIEKRKVAMSQLPQGLFTRLEELVKANLITETATHFELTKLGWLWHSNIMFYLIPESEQNILKKIVFEKLSSNGREITRDELIYSAN
jgi:hypothetical protein